MGGVESGANPHVIGHLFSPEEVLRKEGLPLLAVNGCQVAARVLLSARPLRLLEVHHLLAEDFEAGLLLVDGPVAAIAADGGIVRVGLAD